MIIWDAWIHSCRFGPSLMTLLSDRRVATYIALNTLVPFLLINAPRYLVNGKNRTCSCLFDVCAPACMCSGIEFFFYDVKIAQENQDNYFLIELDAASIVSCVLYSNSSLKILEKWNHYFHFRTVMEMKVLTRWTTFQMPRIKKNMGFNQESFLCLFVLAP